MNRYYAILGVEPTASGKAIHAAFRRRAKELHPDAQSGDASGFILLKRAYDVLSDPAQRADYDRIWEPAPRPPPNPPQPERTSAYYRSRPYRPMPPPPRPPRSASSRRGGMGIARYVLAFVVMAAISLGAVQAMIMFTAAPPSIQTRGPQSLVQTSSAPEPTSEPAAAAPGSSPSGFWDAGSTSTSTSAAPRAKTPR